MPQGHLLAEESDSVCKDKVVFILDKEKSISNNTSDNNTERSNTLLNSQVICKKQGNLLTIR